jgi:hypothetical protein
MNEAGASLLVPFLELSGSRIPWMTTLTFLAMASVKLQGHPLNPKTYWQAVARQNWQ